MTIFIQLNTKYILKNFGNQTTLEPIYFFSQSWRFIWNTSIQHNIAKWLKDVISVSPIVLFHQLCDLAVHQAVLSHQSCSSLSSFWSLLDKDNRKSLGVISLSFIHLDFFFFFSMSFCFLISASISSCSCVRPPAAGLCVRESLVPFSRL